MRLTIKTKQVVGVTSIVGLAVVGLSSLYLSSLVDVRLEESLTRGRLLADVVYHRARTVVTGGDPYAALSADAGLQSILESSAASSPHVIYAAIVDVSGVVVAHSDPMRVGEILPPHGDLAALLERGLFGQLRAIYSDEGQTLEVGQRLLLGSSAFGSIRIGVSTLLIRDDITNALEPALVAVAVALVGSSVVAMLLAQLLLRPIHVLRRSLTRLGERDFGVAEVLPRDEFGELGESLAVASARLLADRAGPGERREPEPLTRWLEDSVAVFDADGALVFASSDMRAALPADAQGQSVSRLFTPEHPYRTLVEDGLTRGQSNGPLTVLLPSVPPGGDKNPAASGEQVVRTDVLRSRNGALAGVLLVARDADRLRQVQFTLNHSRRIAALGRLSAGLAHEIKNPLNATMIRLELLRQQLSPAGTESVATSGRADGSSIVGSEPGEVSELGEHVEVIAAQIRRLDEVVQGFLKFIRPEDIRLQPVALVDILAGIMPIIEAEAQSHGVVVRTDVPADLPDLAADQAMLEQALLNLAINAVQAMRQGGTLRIAAAPTWGRYVAVVVEDGGIGISPTNLDKIFDLYFTTKEGGSGIGLSMVFRAVHLHGGEITVESTPGRGTTFRLLLPQA